MFKKKTIFLVALVFLVTSCANTFDSAKRGLTGAKRKSTDEFFIQKKDPLILPPDFESLPSPSEREEGAQEEVSSFEKKLKKATETEITSTSAGSSTEDSILKRIRKQ